MEPYLPIPRPLPFPSFIHSEPHSASQQYPPSFTPLTSTHTSVLLPLHSSSSSPVQTRSGNVTNGCRDSDGLRSLSVTDFDVCHERSLRLYFLAFILGSGLLSVLILLLLLRVTICQIFDYVTLQSASNQFP